MIRLMTEQVERDDLMREAEIVLRDNRFALVRSEGVGERMLEAWHKYSTGMDELLRELGVDWPPGERRPRRYDRG
jgi:hypothetical protein